MQSRNPDLLQSLELLPRRAARIIYNLPHDMHTDEVYRRSNRNTSTFYNNGKKLCHHMISS